MNFHELWFFILNVLSILFIFSLGLGVYHTIEILDIILK